MEQKEIENMGKEEVHELLNAARGRNLKDVTTPTGNAVRLEFEAWGEDWTFETNLHSGSMWLHHHGEETETVWENTNTY